MNDLKAYEVVVYSTVDDTFWVNNRRYKCTNGKVYVVTDCPATIFDEWGDAVKSITVLGAGACTFKGPQTVSNRDEFGILKDCKK